MPRSYFFAASLAGSAAGAEAGAAAGAGATIAGGDTVTGAAGALASVHAPISGTIISATMLMILISGFTAGPAVSLYGSPTVSPVTAALCASDPLPPWWPSSMYFFALSQAPPPDVIEIATNSPVTMVPSSIAPSAAKAASLPATMSTTTHRMIGA